MKINTIKDAVWAGDQDKLDKLAPCRCCCFEHTFSSCPARSWFGCRGQYNESENWDEWAAFYKRTRGMSIDEFFDT